MITCIHGHYQFLQDGHILFESNNLITLFGESFFLNRAINDHFEPIQYILLGTGSTRPTKTDDSLANMTVKKKVTSSVDLDKKQIILEASFEANEVINTSEIGVTNGNVLISHDTFQKINTDFLGDSIGTVDVKYTFELTTGAMRKDFTKSENKNYTYWVAEPNTVVGVYEKDTDCGYRKVDSVNDVESNVGSYYYSIDTKNLYIHTTRDSNPNLENIIIETK